MDLENVAKTLHRRFAAFTERLIRDYYVSDVVALTERKQHWRRWKGLREDQRRIYRDDAAALASEADLHPSALRFYADPQACVKKPRPGPTPAGGGRGDRRRPVGAGGTGLGGAAGRDAMPMNRVESPRHLHDMLARFSEDLARGAVVTDEPPVQRTASRCLGPID